jgi:hypothetical protein
MQLKKASDAMGIQPIFLWADEDENDGSGKLPFPAIGCARPLASGEVFVGFGAITLSIGRAANIVMLSLYPTIL